MFTAISAFLTTLYVLVFIFVDDEEINMWASVIFGEYTVGFILLGSIFNDPMILLSIISLPLCIIHSFAYKNCYTGLEVLLDIRGLVAEWIENMMK